MLTNLKIALAAAIVFGTLAPSFAKDRFHHRHGQPSTQYSDSAQTDLYKGW